MFFLASWMAIGIIIARAPTLFIKADAKAVMAERVSTWRRMLFPSFFRCRAMASITPELSIPRLIIMTATTVITAEWPNPLNASLGDITPNMARINSALSATRS